MSLDYPLKQFNCYEFASDSVPFAEKKMASDLNAGQCRPKFEEHEMLVMLQGPTVIQ